ncbi:TrmB family transcriptional regulator [Thermococcus thioreducens]|uniref:Sugar-specific transcriptional regulator TrmB n=1 Tax=Thermococcus thioreducens TaxID=277988 RepID=A0A0Q2QSC0_9EURY|nr:TrmB family transcriptional regulator [Thermococcus thioreducens]ASJ13028.1 TrmB family transcriptional regulator [Thermococcus thioreducens]KQH82925.1 TrmB family transcriptional regulator [Thermococcus thioreducens]SEV82135.1 Sugar-specific transcriptional regulator TrmB [Thermococcus thioreducens]
MEEKEIKSLLKELGLNEYEVRAYLTLIRNGPLTAGELATLSKVPQPRIYDVIRTLMAKGFVTTSQGRPKQVIPLSPDSVMDAIKRRYDEKIETLKAALEKLYTPRGEIGSVTVVKSRITLEEYIRRAIRNSRFHLSIAVPRELLDRLKDDLGVKRDSVRINLFVYGEGEVPPIATEIRMREVPDPIIIIQDRDMGIYLPYEALTAGSSLHGYGLVIHDNNLLFMLDRYFYHALWPTGRVVYREERALRLPREYIHIRELVSDLRRFSIQNAKVEVFGRFVRSGEPVHLVGRIVEFYEDEGKVISNITVETEDGERHVVGGWNASLEDIEAERIILFE